MRFREWFKKYFIPREENGHKPHLLRWEATIVILGLVLVIELFFLAALVVPPVAKFLALILPDTLVQGTNEIRMERNLQPFRTNSLLVKAARLKAEDMAAKKYFAHTNPEGLSPWYWLDKVGYNFSYAGENLAINFIDSEDALQAWLHSPTHNANILNKNFTEIGIATAQGTYEGRPTTFIVQFFGTPALAAVAERETRALSQSELASSEIFIAVAGAETAPPAGKIENPPLAVRLLPTPHRIINFLYLVIGTIIVLALILEIFVKIKIQHPPLIVNGALMLLIISAVMVFNQYLLLSQAKII